MKRRMFIILLTVLVGALGTILVRADDEVRKYYVQLDHEGCQDGSKECPFSTELTAVKAGKAQVCPTRMFEVYWRDDANSEYEFLLSEWGEKPIGQTGLPVASSIQIALVALAGFILLAVARYLQRRAARRTVVR